MATTKTMSDAAVTKNIVARMDSYVRQLAAQTERSIAEELMLTLSINARRLGQELPAGCEVARERFAATVRKVGELRDGMHAFRDEVAATIEHLYDKKPNVWESSNRRRRRGWWQTQGQWEQQKRLRDFRQRESFLLADSQLLLALVGESAREFAVTWRDDREKWQRQVRLLRALIQEARRFRPPALALAV